MIEFFVVRAIFRYIGDLAEDRNRTRAWGWLAVVLWLVGEVSGAIVAVFGVASTDGAAYLGALAGAAVGAGIAFAIVAALPTLPPPGFPTARALR
jgi:hypothetical protein